MEFESESGKDLTIGEDYLLHSIETVIKSWKFVLLLSLASVLSAYFYAMSLPNLYKAKGSFIPPTKREGGVSGFLSQVSPLSFLNLGGGGGVNAFEVLRKYFEKRDSLETLFDKFGIIERYKLQHASYEKVKDALLGNLTIQLDAKSGVAHVYFIDEDPKFAANIVNYVIRELASISTESVVSDNQKKVNFLFARLTEIKSKLRESEENIRDLKRGLGISQLDAQLGSTLNTIGRLQSELMITEMKLKVRLELGVNKEHPELRQYQLEINELKKQISNFFTSDKVGLQNKDSSGFLPLKMIPDLEFNLRELERERTAQQEIFKVVIKEYELAKIESSKEQSGVEVIEYADAPERKDGPRRGLILVSTFVLSILVGVFAALAKDYLFKLRRRQRVKFSN